MLQFMFVLLVLAILVVVTLSGVFLGSLLLGGMLAASKRARLLAPVFLVVVPAAAAGALIGGAAVGYFAVRADSSLMLLGPLGGLVAGGAAGLSVGTAGALFWWWRISRVKRKSQDPGSMS